MLPCPVVQRNVSSEGSSLLTHLCYTSCSVIHDRVFFCRAWLGCAGPERINGCVLLVTLAVGSAATSYGVLVGAFSTTQQRSAVFGSTSVVILSALGGIWVPLYIMPEAMRTVGNFSPLNWSMEAYNAVLLRDGSMAELSPFLIPLVIFTVVCIAIAIFAERYISRK